MNPDSDSRPHRQLLTDSLFSEVLQKANTSPRKRANHNFHELSEVYQRFLNVLTRDTYVQAHRHKFPPKPETFLALKGDLGFILFNDDGSIQETHYLSSQGPKVQFMESILFLEYFILSFVFPKTRFVLKESQGLMNPQQIKILLPGLRLRLIQIGANIWIS